MIPGWLFLAGGGLVLVLVVGSAVADPKNWGRAPADQVVDVTASCLVTWHPLSSTWEEAPPVVSVSSSKLLNVQAWFTNALSFLTSPSLPVQFTIEDATTHAPLRVLMDHTGSGGFLGSSRDARVTFREVPVGSYVLDVKILGADNGVLVDQSRDLTIIPGAAS